MKKLDLVPRDFSTFKKVQCSIALGILLATSAPIAAEESRATSIIEHSVLVDISQTKQRLVVAGERGNILISDNDGQTWLPIATPVTEMITAVFFLENGYGWAVGHDSNILFSSDNGSTWQLQYDGLALKQLEIEQQITNFNQQLNTSQTQLTALTAGTDGSSIAELEDSIAFIKDELDYLTEKSSNLAVDPLLDVWFIDQNNGFVIGSFGQILSTQNGGKSWQNISDDIGNEYGLHLNSIIGDNEGNLIIVGESGTFIRSMNNGKSWQTLNFPYNGSLFGALVSKSSKQLYTFGLKGNLFVSSDLGNNWQQLPTQVDETLNSATELNDGRILVVGNSGIKFIVNQDLTISQLPASNRLSLVSSTQTETGRLLTVGLGGIQTFDQLFGSTEQLMEQH